MARVLIADDEQLVTLALAHFLSGRGHEVRTASTPAETIESARKVAPDILVIDYMLGHDRLGTDVACELQATLPSLGVLLLTGLPLDRVEHELARVSRAQVLFKPFELDLLEGAIAKLTSTTTVLAPRAAPKAPRDPGPPLMEILDRVAHELRNPLSPMQMAAQLLAAETPPASKQGWALEVIQQQVGELSRVLDDLLDVARAMNDSLELTPRRADLGDLALRAVNEAGPALGRRAKDLSHTVTAEPTEAVVDVDRFVRALVQILANAARWSEPGTPIVVEVLRAADEVVVQVTDDGVGIAPGDRDRALEPFVQLRPGGGMGIGLALARAVVVGAGGRIELKDGPEGRGTRVCSSFPSPVEAD